MAKKFEVNDDAAGGTNEPRASGKTFDITGESFVAVGGVRPEGRFGISGSTRPKRCPRCRTEDSVTRGARDHWRCRTCDFSWRWVG
ncbi:MAG TPA: hypothetical protein VNZ44_19930 [Pyrinomonadaceae bacterium]|nr:hypothetical protein [Pyrinomonadaceae bacterium]